MKKKSIYIIAAFIIFTCNKINGQEQIPVGYFRSPLDITHYITGTFAEPRSNHLHSGIDLATGGRTGLNIYAMADGYISRIKISPGGYGKALYLTHPNGYVTVYAHLNEFNVILEDYVNKKQKEQESWAIELFPDPGLFQFKKGEIIGYSGNTGNSTGPHLHMEIRSEKSERPLNPALFGIYATDNISPVIKKLMIYPATDNSTVNSKNKPVIYGFNHIPSNRKYTLPDTVKIRGSCYFGIIVRDYVSGTKISTGVYALEMTIDTTLWFAYKLDSFSFDETRIINDMIDYREYMKSRDRYSLLKTSPGNRFNAYSVKKNNGIINFTKDTNYKICITTTDFKGQSASLKFVLSGKPEIQTDKLTKHIGQYFRYDTTNLFEENDIKIYIYDNTLFNDLNFMYKRMPNHINHYSALHEVSDAGIPLLQLIDFAIRADSLSDSLKNKAVIAKIQNNNSLQSLGGKYQDGWIKTQAGSFGRFIIAVDTIIPQIQFLNFRDGGNIAGQKELKIKITDELSGIETYRIEANGKWIMSIYDSKYNLLTSPIDDNFPKGKVDITIKAGDACGNIHTRSISLYNGF